MYDGTVRLTESQSFQRSDLRVPEPRFDDSALANRRDHVINGLNLIVPLTARLPEEGSSRQQSFEAPEESQVAPLGLDESVSC